MNGLIHAFDAGAVSELGSASSFVHSSRQVKQSDNISAKLKILMFISWVQ